MEAKHPAKFQNKESLRRFLGREAANAYMSSRLFPEEIDDNTPIVPNSGRLKWLSDLFGKRSEKLSDDDFEREYYRKMAVEGRYFTL